MISIIDSGKLVNTDASPMVPRSCELVGLSTDSKPTGVSVGNGWTFIEMDTGKVFFYNAEDEEWLEFAGSGGGGGQGGSNVLVVGINMATMTLDKTWQEIKDADFAIIEVKNNEHLKQITYINKIADAEASFTVSATLGNETLDFAATSADGYPVAQLGD